MGVNTEKYVRKPLYVDAVRVTTDNFDDVAVWCDGEIQAETNPNTGAKKQFIRVRVQLPKIPRQTQAFVGDWILYTERGYKVYTHKAFRAAFDRVENATDEPPELPATHAVMEPQSDTPHTIEEVRVKPQSDYEDEPQPDPIPEQEPADAAAGKRVLSLAEQVAMGPDQVRELIRSGEAVLSQDLKESA